MKGTNGSEISFSGGKRGTCLAKIQKLEKERANRRNKIEKARADRVAKEARNIANGNPGDVDFMGMIKAFRNERAGTALPHEHSMSGMKICIAIRKRPTNSKERARKDHDSVSCFNPEVTVHDCKLKVDGISKYLDSVGFRFDQAFGEEVDNQLVYDCTAKPLVPFVLNHGRATVFAYGQTGSGKTYTMLGIQQNATADLFEHLEEMPGGDSLCVFVSFFEIYGGHCQDLLNGRNRVVVREDGKGGVVIAGLEEKEAMNAEGLEELIADGNRNRTTHATESNDQSSRSHAICQISIRNISTRRLHGKLSLIDLAGSERGADTKSHDRQRRAEGGDINKSLLALKECIRALDSDSVHVPYRASKLTLVLKDSFTRKGARTVMIATVSPGASSADHTINTLRYADRVKENKVEQFRPGVNEGFPTVAPPAGVLPGDHPLPLDQPPYPPSPSSPVSSNRIASATAGEHREGFSSSQRRQLHRRRGGRTSSVTLKTGRADVASPPHIARGNPVDRSGGGRVGNSRGASMNELTRGRMEVDSGMGRRLYPSPSPERAGSTTLSTSPVVSYMRRRVARHHHPEENDEERMNDEFGEIHETDLSLFEEEDALLNLHMNTVKENAELLTQEGSLLQSMQGRELSEYNIDRYANHLSEIINRKMTLLSTLQGHLRNFVDRREDPNDDPQY